MLESACEHCNHLQREQSANQRTELAGPFETPQEQNTCLCREWLTVQQVVARAQPSLGNDALQLFGNEDALASTQWDCGKMDTIYGFCNTKMWIKKRLAKSSNINP
jgi:hypothetical protein